MEERLTGIEKIISKENAQKQIVETKGIFEQDELVFIKYVSENPGRTKTEILEVFEKKGYYDVTRSPKVSLRILNELEKYGALVFLPDPNHRQIQRVHINDNSLLLDLERILNRFKEAIAAAINSYSSTNEDKPISSDEDAINYFRAVFTTYQQFVAFIMIHGLLDWPRITSNPDTLKRAYQLTFSKLIEIQQAMKDALDKSKVAFRLNIVLTSWSLRPEFMRDGIEAAKAHDALPQLMKLFDLTWLVSYNDFPFARIVFESSLGEKGELALTNERPKDWREPFVKWLEAIEKIESQAKDKASKSDSQGHNKKEGSN
jgi:hypothetical protein